MRVEVLISGSSENASSEFKINPRTVGTSIFKLAHAGELTGLNQTIGELRAG
jgi:hypothetical protein